MAALDRAEFDRVDEADVLAELAATRGRFGRGEPPAHPGLISWTTQAFRLFRAARRHHEQRFGRSSPVPGGPSWVARDDRPRPDPRRGMSYYERSCWGRRYASDDGSARELWTFSFGMPKEKTAAELATIAYVAVHGAGGAATPHRVRLVGFGGAADRALVLRECDSTEVDRIFDADARSVLTSVIDGTERTPGGDCTGCKLIEKCPAVLRHQLLPDLAIARRRRRTLSATDLRYYRDCPKRFHLVRELKLRDPSLTESAAVTTGRVVDAWLNDRHLPVTASRCTPHDVRTGLSDGVHRRILAQHTALCPVSSDPGQHRRVQPTLAAYDERLGVNLVATPDLLYSRNGRWVWRETKTSAYPPRAGRSLMHTYPQLAVGVLLLSAGVADRSAPGGSIELEHLQENDCALEDIDADLPEVIAEARAVVAEILGPLLDDTVFAARTSPACAGCEARRWCAEGQQS
ncbi:PD-(D/E)XK nuclease family protein [Micromonospora echinospora]|uniref:PD-(D/E)XK nuclease family protein n=1 Tax=Micromonospora echinospora TaxID=1877 RepID=UPI00366B3179